MSRGDWPTRGSDVRLHDGGRGDTRLVRSDDVILVNSNRGYYSGPGVANSPIKKPDQQYSRETK